MAARRRRSSYYRPSDLYPYRSVRELPRTNTEVFEISICDLPTTILAKICLFLHTGDLLRVCMTSRMLYLPAAMQLYRKIIITSSKELQKTALSQLDAAPHNWGTLVHSSKVYQLVRTVEESDKLAHLVRKIVFVDETTVHSSTEIKCDDGSDEHQLYLTTHLQRILPRVYLNELWCLLQDSNMCMTYPLLSLVLLALSVETYDDCGKPIWDFPNLARLKVYYMLNSSRLQSGTVKLAKSFTASMQLRNLTDLEFEEMHQLSLDSLNRINSMLSEHRQSVWPHFFVVLARNHKRLTLRELGLDGFINDNGNRLALMLSETVELDQLVSLQLDVKETTHLHQSHVNYGSTLLENLTAKTPKLRMLATRPTFDCLFCQHSALITTLESHIPHQLTAFFAVVESPTSAYTQSVYDCISQNQSNLISLKFLDRSSQAADNSAIMKYLPRDQYSWYLRALYCELVLRQTVYKDCFLYDIESIRPSSSISANHSMAQLIRNNHESLARFFDRYFAIEPHCVSPRWLLQLPRLQYLNILGINMYMKQCTDRAAPHIMLNYGEYVDGYSLEPLGYC